MYAAFAIDWGRAFIPSVSPVEVILRGSVMYLTLYCLLRLVLRREAGTVGLADLLLIVLIADASQNAMAAGYQSLTDGILLVATLIFWNFTLDWLGYRFPRLRPYLHPPPLLIVRDGQMIRRNMRKELVTEEELVGQLRLQGIKNLTEVHEARIESDGRISVLPFDTPKRDAPTGPPDKTPT